jgi:hypothetical protein
MDIAQRLELFFRRLAEAPPSASAEESLALVCRLIEEVEDEHCPVPREKPAPFDFTGRMYAPQSDRIQHLAEGTILALTRRHRIYCCANGQINVFHKITKKPVLTKAGKR